MAYVPPADWAEGSDVASPVVGMRGRRPLPRGRRILRRAGHRRAGLCHWLWPFARLAATGHPARSGLMRRLPSLPGCMTIGWADAPS